jgi:hypothetical protein
MESISIREKHQTLGSTYEVIALLLILLIFSILGFLQATRLPIGWLTWGNDVTAWGDEIMFVDPAANLFFKSQWTSASWYGQTQEQFWAGYPPLYSFLLYVWMHLFGFGLAAARSFNIFLTAATAILLWLSVKRSSLVISAPGRIGLVLLVLFAQNYTFNLTTGRPDPLMLLLSVTTLLIASVQSPLWRYGLLIAVVTLFPLTGLALVVYSIITGALILIFLHRKFIREAGAIAFGLLIGLLGLYGFYQANGVWDKFVFSTKNNPTLVGYDLASSLSESMRFGGFLQNRNFQLLLIILIGIAIYRVTKGQFRWRSLLCFSLVASVCIPFGMRFSGAYLFYYGWMAFVPLAISFCSTLEALPLSKMQDRYKSWVIPSIACFLILMAMLGPYFRLVDLTLNWKALDYVPIANLVKQTVKPDDWVFSDSLSYYATKETGVVTTTHWYRDVIPTNEKGKVSVIIMRPSLLNETVTKIGGKWQESGEKITLKFRSLFTKSPNLIELRVYRRQDKI